MNIILFLTDKYFVRWDKQAGQPTKGGYVEEDSYICSLFILCTSIIQWIIPKKQVLNTIRGIDILRENLVFKNSLCSTCSHYECFWGSLFFGPLTRNYLLVAPLQATLSVYISVWMPVWISVWMPVWMSVWISVCIWEVEWFSKLHRCQSLLIIEVQLVSLKRFLQYFNEHNLSIP